MEKSPIASKKRTPTKAMELVHPHPVVMVYPTWKLKGPSPGTEDSSIIDVAMVHWSIMFVEIEVGPSRQEMDTFHT